MISAMPTSMMTGMMRRGTIQSIRIEQWLVIVYAISATAYTTPRRINGMAQPIMLRAITG
jgi:hypothetical protein